MTSEGRKIGVRAMEPYLNVLDYLVGKNEL